MEGEASEIGMYDFTLKTNRDDTFIFGLKYLDITMKKDLGRQRVVVFRKLML